mmetsp:Transcript_2299/g.7051  ORF Transcript_2299/g.7051 Transcript_2299/m.7051 type:complete len:561 (+) Transcript_2299:110-1792(+)
MGRTSGRRHGQERKVPGGGKKRGAGVGMHKDRRRTARREAQVAKKEAKKAKAKLRQLEESRGSKRARTNSEDSAPLVKANGETDMKALQQRLKRRRKTEQERTMEEETQAKDELIDSMVEKAIDKRKVMEEKLTRESLARKRRQQRKLLRRQLEEELEKARERLKCWYPGKEEHLARRERLKRKFDPQRLRGAARPAEEAYPWLYPEYHKEKERREREEEEAELKKGENYFEMYDKRWSEHKELRKVLAAQINLAQACLEHGGHKSTARGSQLLAETAENDIERSLGSRIAYLRAACLIDQGELGHARAVVEAELAREDLVHDDPFVAMLRWDLVLINFIGCRVLGESNVSEQDLEESVVKARDANPLIPFVLANHEDFEHAVNGDAVDTFVGSEQEEALKDFISADQSSPKARLPTFWSLQEAAIVYFVRGVSWWRDAEESDTFIGAEGALDLEVVGGEMEKQATSGKRLSHLEGMFEMVWLRAGDGDSDEFDSEGGEEHKDVAGLAAIEECDEDEDSEDGAGHGDEGSEASEDAGDAKSGGGEGSGSDSDPDDAADSK